MPDITLCTQDNCLAWNWCRRGGKRGDITGKHQSWFCPEPAKVEWLSLMGGEMVSVDCPHFLPADGGKFTWSRGGDDGND